jgi:hypothetical protein
MSRPHPAPTTRHPKKWHFSATDLLPSVQSALHRALHSQRRASAAFSHMISSLLRNHYTYIQLPRGSSFATGRYPDTRRLLRLLQDRCWRHPNILISAPVYISERVLVIHSVSYYVQTTFLSSLDCSIMCLWCGLHPLFLVVSPVFRGAERRIRSLVCS